MYTVLIVEDEMLVSVGLRNMIRWADMNMIIVGDARNGKQGLELYYQKKPDIILTDIRMPVMDGLEMIAQIRKEDQATRIVVLSSYEDFELVRQAFVLGISDYVLKLKMMPEEMENVMRKVQRELLESNIPPKRESAEEVQDSELEVGRKVSEYIMFQSGTYEDFRTYAKTLQLSEEGLTVCVMEFDASVPKSQALDREHAAKIAQAVQNLLQNLLSEHSMGSVWNDKDNRYLIVMGQSGKKSIREKGIARQELINRMQSAVQSCMNKDAVFGVSSFSDSFDNLHSLYTEAVEAFEKAIFLGEKTVCQDSEESQRKYKNILSAFRIRMAGQKCKAEGYMPKILNELDYLLQEKMSKGDAMKEVVIRWVHGVSFDSGIQQKELMVLALTAVEKIRSAASLQDMLEAFEMYLDEKYKSMKDSKTLNRELAEAVSYIKLHYNEADLSLPKVAGEVSISKDYLSRLFKREIGIGFADYVNMQRIKKAQELLVTTHMRSYEIAREVGFQDESYFSRVFKNMVGMRPNEYKRRGLADTDLVQYP